jgi:predicted HicB family RNase H-like nuclease
VGDTKTFPVQLDEDLHRRLKHAAIDDGKSLHEWIVSVLRERVGRDPKGLARGSVKGAAR